MPIVAVARRLSVLCLTFVLALGLGGCSKPSAFKAPVGKFRDASAVVIQSTKVYLTELNKTERDQYIYDHASKIQQIKLDEIEHVQVFSAEGIAARLKALDQLANYTDLLYQLATSNTPETLKTSASDLQKSVTNLSGEVASLTGEDDKSFKAAAGKAFPIIGQILQAFAEQAIDQALRKAVSAGAQPVNDLISAIESDTTVAYQRKRKAYSGTRVIVVDQYNREFAKGAAADPAKIKAYADAISVEEDRWEAFVSAQPSVGLESMKKANEALVKFAAISKPTITDFASFVDAMNSFASTANQIGQAVLEQ